MSAQLKPCPFCGCVRVDPRGWVSTDRHGPACYECGATADDPEKWNRRALPPSVADLAAKGAKPCSVNVRMLVEELDTDKTMITGRAVRALAEVRKEFGL